MNTGSTSLHEKRRRSKNQRTKSRQQLLRDHTGTGYHAPSRLNDDEILISVKPSQLLWLLLIGAFAITAFRGDIPIPEFLQSKLNSFRGESEPVVIVLGENSMSQLNRNGRSRNLKMPSYGGVLLKQVSLKAQSDRSIKPAPKKKNVSKVKPKPRKKKAAASYASKKRSNSMKKRLAKISKKKSNRLKSDRKIGIKVVKKSVELNKRVRIKSMSKTGEVAKSRQMAAKPVMRKVVLRGLNYEVRDLVGCAVTCRLKFSDRNGSSVMVKFSKKRFAGLLAKGAGTADVTGLLGPNRKVLEVNATDFQLRPIRQKNLMVEVPELSSPENLNSDPAALSQTLLDEKKSRRKKAEASEVISNTLTKKKTNDEDSKEVESFQERVENYFDQS